MNSKTLTVIAYLKVNGVDPKEHAIFKEIERVKQYFNKIKEAEEISIVTKPSVTLNKQAAARIIQHSLVREEVSPRIVSDKKQAGNGSSDLAQREREARERLMLKRKQRAENGTPVQTPKPAPIDPLPTEVQTPPQSETPDQDVNMQEGSSAEEGEIEEEESSVQAPEIPQTTATTLREPQSKKRKQKQNSDNTSKLSADRKAEKKARKKAKKEAKMTANGVGNAG